MNSEEAYEIALKKAFAFIKYRPRSEKEVRDRLRLKNIDKSIVDKVIVNFKEIDLIDDHRFAYLWAEDRIQSKFLGKYKLTNELMVKGINHDLIRQVIEDIYNKNNEYDLAEKYILNKYKYQIGTVNKDKIIRSVIRNGFSYSIANDAYESVMESINKE